MQTLGSQSLCSDYWTKRLSIIFSDRRISLSLMTAAADLVLFVAVYTDVVAQVLVSISLMSEGMK